MISMYRSFSFSHWESLCNVDWCVGRYFGSPAEETNIWDALHWNAVSGLQAHKIFELFGNKVTY